MKKVASVSKRKAEHIRINLEQNVLSDRTTGLEKYCFTHEALPELELEKINISLDLFGKRLNAPILISSMTGGTARAGRINQHLAEAAQQTGIAMGVGSQRAALEDPSLIPTFSITRKFAPDILLFSNIGAVQLNYGYSIDDCKRAIDMIRADALILHLNPLQEALQIHGNTDFTGLAGKIEGICAKLEVPVIAKEVGWGISERTAKILFNCGVAAVDVAGAGGTSWSQVEMHRTQDTFRHHLAETFGDWGISTVDSILNVKKAAPGMVIIASGGLKSGLDIIKCIALGASLGGMAGQFLRPASESTKIVLEKVELTIKQILVTMFGIGSPNLSEIGGNLLKKNGL